MPRSLADAVGAARADGTGAVVLYLLVDHARRGRVETWARAIADAGTTALELGFPFSDPVADGPELEAAHARALAHGTRWGDLLAALDAASQHLPCAVMTYANPLWHRGLDRALRELREHGASGLVVPDLGFEESRGAWSRAARKYGLALVRFASPATPEARLRSLVVGARGFLYLVSHYGTTGRTRSAAPMPDLRRLLAVAHELRPDLPVLVGFGVRRPADVVRWRREGADGVAIGSAFERRLASDPSAKALRRFVGPLARAMRTPVAGPRALK